MGMLYRVTRGCLDRCQRVHPENEHVQEDLKHRLHLHVTSGLAEAENRASIFEQQSRIGNKPGALVGRNRAVVPYSNQECRPR